MITSSQEYQEFLAGIAETAPSMMKMRIPTYEPVYEIDLNTRKITPPPFIGVEGDHEAEYIYFQVDRYFDGLDLSNAIGLIVFKNAKNEEYYQIIPYYDIYSIEGKIIFPWVIQAPAALYGGTVSFSVKFYQVDPTSGKLLYELNTLIAKTKVLVGWANMTGQSHTYEMIDPQSLIANSETIDTLNRLLALENELKVYWIDV